MSPRGSVARGNDRAVVSCYGNEHMLINSKSWTKGDCDEEDEIIAHGIVQIKYARQ
jgi:hypothetical protein